MDYKALKKEMQLQAAGIFGAEGFKVSAKPEGVYLRRSRPDGDDVITLDAANYQVQFGMFVTFTIYHSQFARVYGAALGQSKAFVAHCWCINQPLPDDYAQLENYPVSTTEHLTAWLQQCRQCLTVVDDIFYRRFASVEEIQAALNAVPAGQSPYISHPSRHAETGLITARLADSSGYVQLEQQYRTAITEEQIPGDFEEVAAYLQHKTTQELQTINYP